MAGSNASRLIDGGALLASDDECLCTCDISSKFLKSKDGRNGFRTDFTNENGRRNMKRLLTILIAFYLCSVPAMEANICGPYTSTVTVYPSDGSGNSGIACDADIGTNSNLSYAAAHGFAECVDCSSRGIITCENSVGKVNGVDTYSVIRSVVNFDTSFLGANAQVISATLSVKPTNVHFDYGSSDFIRVTTNSIASTCGLTLNDYGSFGDAALATDLSVYSLVTDEYANFSLNQAGLAAINRTGVSRFALRAGLDVNNQQPIAGFYEYFPNAGGTVVFFNSADAAGTSSDPKLIITYVSGFQFSASITASATSGAAPLTVNFSIGSNQPVTGVVWKLNGVQFSLSLTPFLIFTVAGNYRIDAAISSGSATVNATIFITVSACSCR